MSKKNIKKLDVSQCALYKCRRKRRLEELLLLERYDLNHISKAINYYSFEIDKKGCVEKRAITAPCIDLKLIQSRILRLIQSDIRPEWLISGEKGKCYIDNGKAHQASNYLVTMDIEKFYNNCSREQVFRFFTDYLKTSGDVAGVLTDIVTYDKKVPTGCPTSQLIAYYAYRNMFNEINDKAIEFNCCFTLYVDDMTFSSVDPIQFERLVKEISAILYKYGHKAKSRKIRYYSKKQFKPITGTIVGPNHELLVPNNLRRKIYDNFQNIKNTDTDSISENDQKQLRSLRGQIQSAQNIQDEIFPEIDRLTRNIPLEIQNKKRYTKKKKKACIRKNTKKLG